MLADALHWAGAGASSGSPSDTEIAADFDGSKAPLAFDGYDVETKLGKREMGVTFLTPVSVLGPKVGTEPLVEKSLAPRTTHSGSRSEVRKAMSQRRSG